MTRIVTALSHLPPLFYGDVEILGHVLLGHVLLGHVLLGHVLLGHELPAPLPLYFADGST
jgi:hypothetical protein